MIWNLFKVIILKFSTLINSIYICSGAWTTSEEKGFSRWCKSWSLNADLSVNNLFCKGLLEMCFYHFVISFLSFSNSFQLITEEKMTLKSLLHYRLLLNFQLPWYSSVCRDSTIHIHVWLICFHTNTFWPSSFFSLPIQIIFTH